MKLKNALLLGMVCVLLVGCNTVKDDTKNSLDITDSTSADEELLETILPTNEADENLIEGQNTQKEETISEVSGSNPAEGSVSEGSESSQAEESMYGADNAEGCYDDPDDPVKNQNYNVGPPRYE